MSGLLDPHLGGSYTHVNDANTFMPDVWEYLIGKYNISSIADIGTGAGWNARWFHDRKFHVLGIEGDPVALEHNQLPATNLKKHDYTQGPLTIPDTDLAWCSEFVEHVEERFMPNYIATMKCCRWLCMTHGEPGQDGWHHVNLQNSNWWSHRLAEYGLILDPTETAHLRSTDVHKAGWGRRTLMWFRNADFKNGPASN